MRIDLNPVLKKEKKTFTTEADLEMNEFSSKLEFNFDNKEKNIANVLIYSKEKNIYNEIENLEEFKEVLKILCEFNLI